MKIKQNRFFWILTVIFFSSIIGSILLIVVERFIVVSSVTPGRIIYKRYQKENEVYFILKNKFDKFYLSMNKEKYLKLATKENIYVYYSKILKVPTALECEGKITKIKFRFSRIIYISLLCALFVLLSFLIIVNREEDWEENENPVVDSQKFLFYMFGIFSFIVWIYICGKIF